MHSSIYLNVYEHICEKIRSEMRGFVSVINTIFFSEVKNTFSSLLENKITPYKLKSELYKNVCILLQ